MDKVESLGSPLMQWYLGERVHKGFLKYTKHKTNISTKLGLSQSQRLRREEGSVGNCTKLVQSCHFWLDSIEVLTLHY